MARQPTSHAPRKPPCDPPKTAPRAASISSGKRSSAARNAAQSSTSSMPARPSSESPNPVAERPPKLRQNDGDPEREEQRDVDTECRATTRAARRAAAPRRAAAAGRRQRSSTAPRHGLGALEPRPPARLSACAAPGRRRALQQRAVGSAESTSCPTPAARAGGSTASRSTLGGVSDDVWTHVAVERRERRHQALATPGRARPQGPRLPGSGGGGVEHKRRTLGLAERADDRSPEIHASVASSSWKPASPWKPPRLRSPGAAATRKDGVAGCGRRPVHRADVKVVACARGARAVREQGPSGFSRGCASRRRRA